MSEGGYALIVLSSSAHPKRVHNSKYFICVANKQIGGGAFREP